MEDRKEQIPVGLHPDDLDWAHRIGYQVLLEKMNKLDPLAHDYDKRNTCYAGLMRATSRAMKNNQY